MKLFEPGVIGKLSVKNRIVMAAMGNRLVEPDGRIAERGIEFYAARARGGTGLIISCGARTRLIERLPIGLGDSLMADSRVYISRLTELTERIHDFGAKFALQVTAGQGRNIAPETLQAVGAVAPSPLPTFADKSILARELETEEIEGLVNAFRVIGESARIAGIDAIEINAHGGYLIDEFMTALWNKRIDRYGGDLSGRLTFLLEIIKSLRKGAGSDFPIIVKYGLTHYLDGGRGIPEGIEIARRLEAAGVDALDIDAGSHETIYWLIPPTTQPPGCMVDLAHKVKHAVNIPVIAVGRLGHPALAEDILQQGKADFIALGRALLADPEWPDKVMKGRLDDIRPCLGDNDGCRRRVHEGKFISCTVNPACGSENELSISPAGKKKHIIVVGGGPAGMEAARVAGLRGHKVVLLEKEDALGGSLIPASVPDFKQEYRSLISYLSAQVRKLGVEVQLATRATAEMVRQMRPDAVFIATGSRAIIPGIPGVDSAIVVTAVDALLGKKQIGNPVIIIGGGVVGCELALYLAKQGKKVTVVELLDQVAGEMYIVNRIHLLKLLATPNVILLTGTAVLKITEQGVTIRDRQGNQNLINAETVVLACGFQPNTTLLRELRTFVPEVYAIGDCVAPRKVLQAINKAFRLARLV